MVIFYHHSIQLAVLIMTIFWFNYIIDELIIQLGHLKQVKVYPELEFVGHP